MPHTKDYKVWLNGTIVGKNDAKTSVLSHTLHYGLGVFEGIRCYKTADGNSAIFRLDEHVERLFDSAKICMINIPYSQEDIKEAIKETIKANNLSECYIRPLVFLGDGGLGLYTHDSYPVEVAIAAWSWGAYLGEEGMKNGIKIKTSSFNRFHVNTIPTRSKTCGNYVTSVIAKREAIMSGADEALFLDVEGYVAEGSGENIFMVKGSQIITTPMTSILKGITRDAVIKAADDIGFKVEEQRFTKDDLYLADEAFFTGTAAEVTPVGMIDGRVIGKGGRGEVTKKIQDMFFGIVHGKNPKYKKWLTYIND